MITLDLRQQAVTVEELLRHARSDSVLILADDGEEFILESADEFEREVAILGQSEKFMQFLAERAKEKGTVALEALKQEIDAELEAGSAEKV